MVTKTIRNKQISNINLRSSFLKRFVLTCHTVGVQWHNTISYKYYNYYFIMKNIYVRHNDWKAYTILKR